MLVIWTRALAKSNLNIRSLFDPFKSSIHGDPERVMRASSLPLAAPIHDKKNQGFVLIAKGQFIVAWSHFLANNVEDLDNCLRAHAFTQVFP